MEQFERRKAMQQIQTQPNSLLANLKQEAIQNETLRKFSLQHIE